MHSIIFLTEIIGTIGFAFSGALLAIQKDFDIFGIAILGIVAAVGGGFMRDIILGAVPPIMFSTPIYSLAATIVALLVCIPAVRRFMHRPKVYSLVTVLVDSIGLAVFTVNGVIRAAHLYPDNHFLMLFTGVMTGVGGGVIRDVLAGERPYIFTKHIYACASAIGAILCAYLRDYIPENFAFYFGASVILLIRLLSAYYRLKLPHVKVLEEE